MKRQIKRVLSAVLCVLLLYTAVPLTVSAADSGTCGENLTWTFNAETGELTISGTGRMDDFDDYPNYAPWLTHQLEIKTVTISDGVTTIGENAFPYCTKINSVTIPESVTSICEDAFSHCWSLADVSIPSGVTSIGEYSFFCCDSLANVFIPSGVTEIGYNAFGSCSSLTAISVDENNPVYSSDKDGVLYNKDKTLLIQYPIGNARNSFVIPDSVTTIGDSAFDDCDKIEHVTIPDSVTTIGSAAFFDCTNLTKLMIPESVITIDRSAFYGCDSLTSVFIPGSVTTIGLNAFCDCKSLTAFTVAVENPAYSNDTNGVLYNKNKTLLIQYPIGNNRDTFTVPSGVKRIGDDAFRYCDSLLNVTISEGVTTIGSMAFDWCRELKEVTIPKSVSTIEAEAFRYCESLVHVTIPFGVRQISTRTFERCESLESVTIPESVTIIGNGAFEECYNLPSISIPNSVKSIGEEAFYDCRNLTSIIVPDGTTTIGARAFSSCDHLVFVHIPASVTEIGEYLFVRFFVSPAYICSDTEDCFAKTYAEENGIEFRVCKGHDPIAIQNFVPSRTVDFCTTLQFTAVVNDLPEGAEVHWFIDGKDAAEGETYTAKNVKKAFTVQAKTIKDGQTLAESETEKVNVKNSIFDMIVAFFRWILRKLPIVEQAYLGIQYRED